jgi:2-polyprenyl-3-methyl-5-hydroxy-6-metoxy-1,4-benzoquinol methylase
LSFSAIWTRRLKYMLSPQLDLYARLAENLFLVYEEDNPGAASFSVLDYGCGCGFGALQFKSTLEDETVIGLDSDLDAVEFARETIGCVLEIRHADALASDGDELRRRWVKLKEDDGPFGAVLLIEVVEHLSQVSQRSLVEELKSAIEDQGVLVLSTPNKRSQYRKHGGHVGMHDPASLRDLLAPHFEDVAFEDYLGEALPDDTSVSPLVAVCRRPRRA